MKKFINASEQLLEKGKEKYIKNLEILDDYSIKIISNNEIVKEFKEFDDADAGVREKFKELILKDYLIFLIINNNIEKDLTISNEILKFLKIILSYKNKCKYNDICDNGKIIEIIPIIIWIESYLEEIGTLIKLFLLLYTYKK